MSLEQVATSSNSRQHSSTFSGDVEDITIINEQQQQQQYPTTTVKPTAKRVASSSNNNVKDENKNNKKEISSAFTQMIAKNTEKSISPLPTQATKANDEHNKEIFSPTSEGDEDDDEEDFDSDDEEDEEEENDEQNDNNNNNQVSLHHQNNANNNQHQQQREAAMPAWRKNLKPQYRYIPLWFVVLCWCALLGSVLGMLYLSTQPFEDHTHANATTTKTITFGDTDIATTEVPSFPLIDSRWLYVSLPVMYLPSITVFGYVNWLGWQFFTHN